MTQQQIARRDDAAALLEQVVIHGDLAKLTPQERVDYYRRVCESLNLNPYTKPFEYLHLSGRLVLYATRTATDQLARQHHLTLSVVRTERLDDVYVVTARAQGPDGRAVENVGAVAFGHARGDALANLLMKAVTKAYRRATLSYCGLGWLDEMEVDAIPSARRVPVDLETGEIEENGNEELLASEETLRKLWAAAKQAGWKREQLLEHTAATYGRQSPRELTEAQAQEVLRSLEHPDTL
ncbi:MAG: hypothetical protein RB148_12025 [Armatimonadota bacterium]|nr:hypothetical protein [Armatimonadota bacterium]